MKQQQKARERLLRALFPMIAVALATQSQAEPAGANSLNSSPPYLDLRLAPGDLDGFESVARPDFSGSWVLDRRHSDNLKDALRAAAGSDRRDAQGGEGGGGPGGHSGGGGGPGGGGPGGQAGRQGGPPGGGGRGNDTRAVESLFANRLDILHREPLLEIETEQHRKRKLYTDHRGASVTAMGTMGSLASTARWQGSRLVIKTSSGASAQTTQRLRMLASPKRLELVSELSSPDESGDPIIIRQVFLPDGPPVGETGPLRDDAQVGLGALR